MTDQPPAPSGDDARPTDRCPTCGSPVRIVGLWPTRFEPAPSPEVAALVGAVERCLPWLANYQCDGMEEGDRLIADEAFAEAVLARVQAARREGGESR